MKKFKSKKGMTLVELVVTIAILGIVSGFSLTIVVTAMNNYSQAAIVEDEQNTALMIEEFIVRQARVASKIQFVENDDLESSAGSVKPKANKQGYYIAKVGKNVETFTYAKEDTTTGEYNFEGSSPEKYTALSYENVSEITVSVERQKSVVKDTQKKCSYYLNYYIKMISGYVLRGQVIMNNADMVAMDKLSGTADKGLTSNFVDPLKEFTLLKVIDNESTYSVSPDGNCAIMFK